MVIMSEYKLRIKDAFKEDAGRGIVRIDPNLINKLNLKVGDVIRISHTFVKKIILFFDSYKF